MWWCTRPTGTEVPKMLPSSSRQASKATTLRHKPVVGKSYLPTRSTYTVRPLGISEIPENIETSGIPVKHRRRARNRYHHNSISHGVAQTFTENHGTDEIRGTYWFGHAGSAPAHAAASRVWEWIPTSSSVSDHLEWQPETRAGKWREGRLILKKWRGVVPPAIFQERGTTGDHLPGSQSPILKDQNYKQQS